MNKSEHIKKGLLDALEKSLGVVTAVNEFENKKNRITRLINILNYCLNNIFSHIYFRFYIFITNDGCI